MSDLFDSSGDLQTGPGTSTGEHVVYLVVLSLELLLGDFYSEVKKTQKTKNQKPEISR